MPRFLDYILSERNKDARLALLGTPKAVPLGEAREKFIDAVPIAADNVDRFAYENIFAKAMKEEDGILNINPVDILPHAFPPHAKCWVDWRPTVPKVRERTEWNGALAITTRPEEAPERGKWQVDVRFFWKPLHKDWIAQGPAVLSLLEDDEGMILQHRLYLEDDAPLTDNDLRLAQSAAYTGCVTALLAFSFMNCRNVPIWENKSPAKLAKAYERRHGYPLRQYKVIDIVPMSKIVGQPKARDRKSLEEHAAQTLRTIRAHFKTYTERGPLFGRYTGTFLWHEQGDPSKRGYRIK